MLLLSACSIRSLDKTGFAFTFLRLRWIDRCWFVERRFPLQISSNLSFFFLSFLRPNCTLLARSKLRIYRSWYQHQITDVSLFEKPDISICILSAVCYEECAPLNESSYHCVAKMFTVGFSISKFLAFFFFFFFLYEAKSKRDRNNGKRYIHFSRKNTLSLRSRWTSFRLEWNTCRNTPCEIIRGFHPGTTRRGAKLSSTSRLTRALFVFTEVELQ